MVSSCNSTNPSKLKEPDGTSEKAAKNSAMPNRASRPKQVAASEEHSCVIFQRPFMEQIDSPREDVRSKVQHAFIDNMSKVMTLSFNRISGKTSTNFFPTLLESG